MPNKADKKADDDSALRFSRIVEVNRTIRIGMRLLFAAFCIWQIRIYLERTWIDAVVVGLPLIFGPSGVLFLYHKWHASYVAQHNSRVVELEKKIDPSRSSSNLEKK